MELYTHPPYIFMIWCLTEHRVNFAWFQMQLESMFLFRYEWDTCVTVGTLLETGR
jgi:hypothetical protein